MRELAWIASVALGAGLAVWGCTVSSWPAVIIGVVGVVAALGGWMESDCRGGRR